VAVAVANQDTEQEYVDSMASKGPDCSDSEEELLNTEDSSQNIRDEADGTAADREDKAESTGGHTNGEDSNDAAGDVPGLLKGSYVIFITGLKKSFFELQQEEYKLLYKSLASYKVSR
jgi:hypothetical protein